MTQPAIAIRWILTAEQRQKAQDSHTPMKPSTALQLRLDDEDRRVWLLRHGVHVQTYKVAADNREQFPMHPFYIELYLLVLLQLKKEFPQKEFLDLERLIRELIEIVNETFHHRRAQMERTPPSPD